MLFRYDKICLAHNLISDISKIQDIILNKSYFFHDI